MRVAILPLPSWSESHATLSSLLEVLLLELRPFLYSATLAIPRLPGWSAALAPLFLTLFVASTVVVLLWRGHLLLVGTFYLLPHLVLDIWTAYYFLTMEKKGPREYAYFGQ